jgi:hypothetical protein
MAARLFPAFSICEVIDSVKIDEFRQCPSGVWRSDRANAPRNLSKPPLPKPGVPTSYIPSECFKLAIGTAMRGERGEGIVVGALCSPANQFTKYWIKKTNGERYWATLKDLKPL